MSVKKLLLKTPKKSDNDNSWSYKSDNLVIKLYCGDCLNVMDAMLAGSCDITMTSPPYNQLTSFLAKPSGMFTKDHKHPHWFAVSKRRIKDAIEKVEKA